jgi:hypothetical protein
VTRLTPERRVVLEHLAEVGEASPSEIARLWDVALGARGSCFA